MKNIEKFIPNIFWSVVGISTFTILQIFYQYHFYYVEQSQLFLYNKMYLSNLFFSVGGLSEIISQWLIQFYVHPMIGALVTTFLVLLVAVLMTRIMKKVVKNAILIIFPLLTATLLVFLHLDILYYTSGTVAFILCLVSLLGYIKIPTIIYRTIAAVFISALLFWWAGSVSILFSLCILAWELFDNTKKFYFTLIPLVVSIIISIVSVHLGWEGEFRFVFLPDLYFYSKIETTDILYYPWILLPSMIFISFLISKISIKNKIFYIATFIQIVIVIGIIWKVLFPYYGDYKDYKDKELDYYTRTHNWDKIIEESKGIPMTNVLHLFYLNMALMEKGELADQMLSFDQRGSSGLDITNIQSDFFGLLVQSELHFITGNIAASQHAAFEGNVTISLSGSPRFYQRLVQTNLIFGAYDVAEKYIKYLEQTHAYKQWAEEHRIFLYNDQAVENDPLLGKKRRGLPSDLFLLSTNNLDILKELVKTDKSNKAAFEFLAMFNLLQKDVQIFMELIDSYYEGREHTTLPAIFQEAIIIAADDSDTWAKFKVEDATILRYEKLKNIYQKTNGNSDMARSLSKDEFGNSYWYYFMFK